MKPAALPRLYSVAIEVLGTSKLPEAVAALKHALQHGELWAPIRTRRLRAAAAASLRAIGTPQALEALREASEHGPRGARAAARAQLALIE